MFNQDYQNIRVILNNEYFSYVPYNIGMSRETYFKYWKSEYFQAIPGENVALVEEHADWYIHGTTPEIAVKILQDGIIRCGLDSTIVGPAVYSFPVGAGRLFVPRKDLQYIIFKTSQQHVHLVQKEENVNAVIGEADFLEDVRFETAFVLDYEKAVQLVYTQWNPVTAATHYYGCHSMPANLSIPELPSWLAEYHDCL